MVAEVVNLREYNLRDIPSVLRKIASQIETGDFPGAESCALVVAAPEAIEVCVCGEASSPGEAHMILHAGMLKLTDTLYG